MVNKLEQIKRLSLEIIEDASHYAEEGKEFIFDQDAEGALVEILKLSEKVSNTVDELKLALEKSALSYNPNFKSILGKNVKVGYQEFGTKYSLDYKNIDNISEKFYRVDRKYYPEPKEIEAFIEAEQKLPEGVNINDRKKQIVIRFKGEVQDE